MNRESLYLPALLVLAAAATAMPAAAVDRPNFNRAHDAARAAGPIAERAVLAPGVATGRNPIDGGASFVWSLGRDQRAKPGATAEEAARDYLARHAAHWRIDRGSLAALGLQRVFDIGRGPIIAIFGQRVAGVEVDGVRVSVLMKRNLDLVAISGTPVTPRAPRSADGGAGGFALGAQDALSRAFGDLFERDSDGAWRPDGEKAGASVWKLLPSTESALGIALRAPSRVWPVWFAMPDGLVPAYRLEILANAPDDDASYRYVVDARDGTLLARTNLTVSEQAALTAPQGDDPFDYRVFAATTGLDTPLDGPISDVTPHPTGNPDGTEPVFVAPVDISMLGFNSFLDPWLPNGSTETVGNNVDAYADLEAPDGLTPSTTDTRAGVTAPGEFHHTYDTAVDAAGDSAQIQGAVTHLFYVTNWLHDYFYDSGFDEAGGNAQTDNFGRGGVEGDAMNAESDDFGGMNNANMSTPGDGGTPRMQMFKWSGVDDVFVRRESPDPDTDFAAQGAAYGPQGFDVTDSLVLWDDDIVGGAGGSESDGCEPPTVPGDITGKIALVDRGFCTFVLKSQNAQAAGALGVIIANNVPVGLPPMGGAEPTGVTIGSLGISQADGTTLKNDLIAGPVSVRLFRDPGPLRSGSLDTQIVAHEWGHYFHHRQQSCGGQECGAQSEGWGDFIALHTAVEEGDLYDGGVYGAAIYSTATFGPNYAYFGIRRYPYSTDFSKNGLTFGHIRNSATLPAVPPVFPNGGPNSEVHNAGEVWAMGLFEAYVALLTDESTDGPMGGPRLTFEEARRAMADHISAGLQGSPIESTFTETRDSILAAAYAVEQLDFNAMAAAWATRGFGTCAVSPPVSSTTFNETVQTFALAGRLEVEDIQVDDDASCDDDGYLDAGEAGTITVTVGNFGPAVLTGAMVSVNSDNPNVTFPSGSSGALGAIGFGDTDDVTIAIAASGATVPLSTVTFNVTVSHVDSCGPASGSRTIHLASDESPGNLDNVEADGSTWTQTGDLGIWRQEVESGNTFWHGDDAGGVTDAQLVSPPIQVNASGNFILSFDHRYSFEFDGTFWDGGVVEFTTDGGTNWDDLSDLVSMPYDGVITDISGNPLGNQMAFGGQSTGYPAMNRLTLDLGTALQGDTVQFRFRIGTDEAISAPGWDVDDIAVQGASSPPFLPLGPDPGCASSWIFSDGFEIGSAAAWSAQAP